MMMPVGDIIIIADTKPDRFNLLLQFAHLQDALEPRPIHPDVEKQLRALPHPSIPVAATTFLDRAMASIHTTAEEDDRFRAPRGSLYSRKKMKVFHHTQSSHCSSIPQTRPVRQEGTLECSAFQKLTTQGGTRNLAAVMHSDKPRPSVQDKHLCDESVLGRQASTILSNVIPTDSLQRVPTASPIDVIPTDALQRGSTTAMSGGNEPDSATTKVADVTPPKIGGEDYHTNDPPDDPRDDTNTTHATPSAFWLSRRLLMLMKESERSQSQLEDWDEDHGLPKSHCLTMVSSSRSRRQLQQGVILPKWDGTPLISDNVELGKSLKRRRRVRTQPTLPKLHRDS
jgi:hypothetical protein